MKAVITYGTGQGTTAKIATAVAEGMKESGVDAGAVRLELLAPARIAAADIFGIGTPVHFYREARYVADFLPGLPKLDGKRAFAFCTCGMDQPGETLNRLHGALAERGAVVVGTESFSSAMSYLPLRVRGLGNPETLPDDSVLAAARQFGARMAAAAQASTAINAPPVSTLTKLKARLLADTRIRRRIFPGVRLNLSACTGYGSCLSRCLVNGLQRNDGETLPYFTDSCVHCLECITWCPRGAIEVDSKFKEWTATLSYRLGIH